MWCRSRPVTKANYASAETEVILADYVRKIAKGTCSEGVGVFLHQRAAMDPKERTILRPNFDTLYSFADDPDRYQILEVIDEDHWILLINDKPGSYTLTKESVGSRYAFAFVRTQVNVQDPADVKAAGAVQDQILLQQAETLVLQDILALRALHVGQKWPLERKAN